MDIPYLIETKAPPWQKDAACQYYPFEVFFPGQGEKSKGALRICNEECPVRAKCLDWALDQEKEYIPHGIFGGKTASQRMKLKRCRLRGCKELTEFTSGNTEGSMIFCSPSHQKRHEHQIQLRFEAKFWNTYNNGIFYKQGTVRN